VIVNLVVNARDAMPAGGRIDLATSLFYPDGAEDEPQAMLAVTDTGEGMSFETTAHVFDPFFTQRHGNRSGIGLATSQAIVTRAGGTITASSTPGAGSTFSVHLPIAGAGDGELADLDALGAAEAARKTVLVVEDEPALRELERILLESEGYAVLAAGTGGEALNLAARHGDSLELLVTDVVLPDLSGPALAAELVGLGHDVPVLYISGYDRDLLASRGLLDGPARVIAKPFTNEIFRAELRAALAERAS
jgi:two-component system, cell cycle sensor histidine kinase and response regulator CckA